MGIFLLLLVFVKLSPSHGEAEAEAQRDREGERETGLFSCDKQLGKCNSVEMCEKVQTPSLEL